MRAGPAARLPELYEAEAGARFRDPPGPARDALAAAAYCCGVS